MNFHRYTPQSTLLDVKYFWAGNDADVAFNQRLPALPDPFPMLAINCGAPLIWQMQNGARVELPRAIFFRPQINPLNIFAEGSFHAIGLNLCAWGTRLLVDEQTDLAMPIIPLNSIWQNFARILETTFHQYGEAEAVATLEQFVCDLHAQARTDVAPIRSAIERLHTTNGQFSLGKLAAHVYLSPSQLERRFKALVGISPKSFARLIRFDAIVNAWEFDPSRRIVGLVHKFGYADQAHFAHEFKTFTSRTPREYMMDHRQQNADFLQDVSP